MGLSVVERYLKEKHGYVVIDQGVRIPRTNLVEAIMAVRGCDEEAVRK